MNASALTPESTARIDRLMRRALSQRVFPGAALLVTREGRTCFERAYGHSDLF